MKQAPPFCIQVEFSEGCNLACSFCGINGIREKPGKFKFMDLYTAHMLAMSIANAGWTSRIEFAMHGEPSLHPDVLRMVSAFRQYLPNQLMMTSNGGGLLKSPRQQIEDLFDAGLNVLAIDEYQSVGIWKKLRERLGDYPYLEYPDDKGASPHRRWPKGTRQLILIKDITVAETGNHSVLNNHCGSGAPLEQVNARCAKPFRELAVRWDGSVALCCNDWRGWHRVGHVLENSVEEIWQSPVFQSARRYLYHGMRDFKPCQGCNAKSYRVGLLPDKLGKETLPKPDEQDAENVRPLDQPLSPIVRRPWE